MISYSIRQAKPEDISQIMKVEKNAFIPQIQEEEKVFSKRIELCPSLFFVFEADEKIFGYFCAEYLSKVPEKPDELKLGHTPEDSLATKKILYISSFAILSDFRGQGLGKKLWADAVKKLEEKKPEKIFLLVNKVWTGAKHIYEQSGFSVLKTFPMFFPTDTNELSDGILMVKNLD
ncbi:MAG: GNAT family N-acetyltransferase [Treponema sp.]|nr:GNAT family N-acetyltransferase [Treponema sp.]